MTPFSLTEVSLPRAGAAVYVEGNGKVACDGTFADPAPNAFSLSRDTCLAAASRVCRDACYVRGLARVAPAVAAAHEVNTTVLRGLLADIAEPVSAGDGGLLVSRASAAAVDLGAWIAEFCPGGFRWHVSGDVESALHARWIAKVCAASPGVQHSIYTRSRDVCVLAYLACAKNLTVNLSADVTTFREVQPEAEYFGVRLAYLATMLDLEHGLPPLRPGDVVLPDYPLRGRDLADPESHPWWRGLTAAQRALVCPADFYGQSEARRCMTCRRCLEPFVASAGRVEA